LCLLAYLRSKVWGYLVAIAWYKCCPCKILHLTCQALQ
jgi:hypothetical protein